MCDFIALVVPGDADQAALASQIEQFKLGSGLSPVGIAGSTVILNVEPRGPCHCGTALGSLEPPPPARAVRDRDIARKRRAGWSEARINRWLQQKDAAGKRRESAHEGTVATIQGDGTVHGWLPFVREVLASGATRELGLVVTSGDYSGSVDSKTVKLSDLSPRVLLTMRHDVVYEFVK